VRQATCWLFVFPVFLTPCHPRPPASCSTYTAHACDSCPTYIDHACEAEQHSCACVLPLRPCQVFRLRMLLHSGSLSHVAYI
jgi:hypothetical protein